MTVGRPGPASLQGRGVRFGSALTERVSPGAVHPDRCGRDAGVEMGCCRPTLPYL
ncbi:hypothetical protein [Azospirillum endophyticum]